MRLSISQMQTRRGAKEVKIRSTSYERPRLTVMPCLNAQAYDLARYFIFSRRRYDDDDDDNNNNNKEAEKILKYKDLTIRIQRTWNVKTNVIPVIIGATRTISKSIRKYLSNVPGKHEIKELQKTAILGTAHIRWKVLM